MDPLEGPFSGKSYFVKLRTGLRRKRVLLRGRLEEAKGMARIWGSKLLVSSYQGGCPFGPEHLLMKVGLIDPTRVGKFRHLLLSIENCLKVSPPVRDGLFSVLIRDMLSGLAKAWCALLPIRLHIIENYYN